MIHKQALMIKKHEYYYISTRLDLNLHLGNQKTSFPPKFSVTAS